MPPPKVPLHIPELAEDFIALLNGAVVDAAGILLNLVTVNAFFTFAIGDKVHLAVMVFDAGIYIGFHAEGSAFKCL